jgi:hypothetical protein
VGKQYHVHGIGHKDRSKENGHLVTRKARHTIGAEINHLEETDLDTVPDHIHHKLQQKMTSVLNLTRQARCEKLTPNADVAKHEAV